MVDPDLNPVLVPLNEIELDAMRWTRDWHLYTDENAKVSRDGTITPSASLSD